MSARTRTRSAMRHDPAGPTIEEALRTLRDRHQTALWLVPSLLLLAAMALPFLGR